MGKSWSIFKREGGKTITNWHLFCELPHRPSIFMFLIIIKWLNMTPRAWRMIASWHENELLWEMKIFNSLLLLTFIWLPWITTQQRDSAMLLHWIAYPRAQNCINIYHVCFCSWHHWTDSLSILYLSCIADIVHPLI